MSVQEITTVTKSTADLVVGDIVHDHGMRIQLVEREVRPSYDEDIEAALVAAGHKPESYIFAGKVLNVDEVNEAGTVPFSWRCERRPQYVGTAYYSEDGTAWTVAGNAFAIRTVEVQ